MEPPLTPTTSHLSQAQLSRPCLLDRKGDPTAELSAALPWMCSRLRQEQQWVGGEAREGGAVEGGPITVGGSRGGVGETIGMPGRFGT